MAQALKPAPQQEVAQVAKKAAEIEQLRTLMRSGALSQGVAHVAIAKAEEELQGLQRARPAQEGKQTARVIRLLPK
jgi:hypothetical protein